MKDKLQMYGLIGALLLVALLSPVIISVVNNMVSRSGRERPEVEAPNETEMITIQIDKLLLGEELIKIPALADLNANPIQVSAPVLMLVLAGIFLGGIAVVGGGLGFTYKFLDRFVLGTKESQTFQETTRTLEKKQKDALKLINKARPADPIPSHEEPRWSAAATSIIALLFAWIMGLTFATVFFPNGGVEIGEQLVSGAAITSWTFIILTALLLIFVYRPHVFIHQVEANANKATDWGIIWVIVAGALILGLGTGLMIAVRSAGG
ncbi:MAG: hypothetical protein KA314_20850 [Chloroflexi bacterium]|nr:hypothetical protein [Chloroflexota bacterium]MBP8058288.1 hypothetical protein [Chloroflexota bacterium]